MKIKMWCLVHKPNDNPIAIAVRETWVVGFLHKKDLLAEVGPVEHDEEVKKIEFEC